MSKKNNPNYIDAREFPEEKLNPNRPHEYRKKHGVSPAGQIHEIRRRMKEEDPEAYKAMCKKNGENRAKTISMQKRAKEILNMVITLSESEKEVFLDGLKNSEEITVQDAILYAQASKAISDKDTAAAVFVRDTSGQKPKDVIENTVSVDTLLKNNGILDEEEED